MPKKTKKTKEAKTAKPAKTAKHVVGVCPECGCRHFFEDASRGEQVCAKCGLVLEDTMIDVSQEWRAFDEEQRSKRARTGAPLTFSVDYQEPIVIKEKDEIKIVKIGEFVDKIVKENKDKIIKQGILEIVFLENSDIQTVSFDKDYKIDFYSLKEVSRHPVREVYEVEIEGGKKIKVTGSHSLFTVVDDEIVPARVESLKTGDFLVAPKWLPSAKAELEINLLNEFKKIAVFYKNIYLRHISDENVFLKLDATKRQIKNWKRHKTIPLHALPDLNLKPNGEKIGIYSSPVELPLKLDITKDFCKLLGYYVSEGDCSEHVVRFSFGKHENGYINEVKTVLKSIFGVDAKEYDHGSSVQLEAKSKLLSLIFSEILNAGCNAKEKRIPSIIFSLPEDMKMAFIQSYINGDGHVWQRKMEGRKDTQVGTITANKDLADDVLMLYLQLGIHANYCEAHTPSHTIQKTGQLIPACTAHMVRITNPDLAVKLGFLSNIPERKRKEAIEELVPAPLKYQKEWKYRKRIRIGRELAISIAKKYNDKKLLKLVTAPFMFLRVKSIKLVRPTTNYAYDLTVPNCENFVCSTLFAKNTKHDKGLTTEIGKGPGELFKVAPGKRAQYYRLTKWQKRLVESKDRNLSFALSELQRIISFLGLHRGVHEQVAKKYEQAVDRGLVRGRSMESVIAALLYAVCRELGTPRTLEEIAEASGVERREIGRTYRYIARELGVRILPASSQHYVPRFASMLGLSDKVQATAIQILQEAKKKDVTSGKGPTGVAAAALYIAAVLEGEKKTQREIADAVGVTEVTIRNRFKEIVDKLGIQKQVEEKVREE